MTVVSPDFRPARPAPRRETYRLEWGSALAALRKLLKNKEDTTQVFEIMRALAGRSGPKGYDRLLTTLEGGRIAYERVELVQRLMDRPWVESFAPGTVGAAYAEFTARENLSAEGLAEESRKGMAAETVDIAHPYAWFGRRVRDTHDIWHMLTGYGRDGLGEACLTGFYFAQTGALGWAFIAVGAALNAGKTQGLPVRRAILEGYRRGKAAKWLLGEDFERLMAEPMEQARARLNILPATIYNSIPPQFRDHEASPAAAAPVVGEALQAA